MFSLGSERVRNVGPTAFLQVLGDPLKAHRRFLSQPPRQPLFPLIPYARLAQGLVVPSQPAHLLSQQAVRFGLLLLPPFRHILGGQVPGKSSLIVEALQRLSEGNDETSHPRPALSGPSSK